MTLASDMPIEEGPFGGADKLERLESLESTQRPALPIPERKTYVPGWYEEHEFNVEVCNEDGKGLGFNITEVAPERRWAIREDGRLYPQHEFEERQNRWWRGWYALAGQPPADTNVRPIPTAEGFVRKRVSKTDSSRLEHIVTGLNQIASEMPEDEDDFVGAKDSPGWEAKPIEETKTKADPRLSALLDRLGGTPDEVAAKLEEILGAGAIVSEHEPFTARPHPTKEGKELMPCGKVVTAGYLKNHFRHCSAEECSPPEDHENYVAPFGGNGD